jgi:hypothetical protein
MIGSGGKSMPLRPDWASSGEVVANAISVVKSMAILIGKLRPS